MTLVDYCTEFDEQSKTLIRISDDGALDLLRIVRLVEQYEADIVEVWVPMGKSNPTLMQTNAFIRQGTEQRDGKHYSRFVRVFHATVDATSELGGPSIPVHGMALTECHAIQGSLEAYRASRQQEKEEIQ